jgi:hypothetical protein
MGSNEQSSFSPTRSSFIRNPGRVPATSRDELERAKLVLPHAFIRPPEARSWGYFR